jgi:hypothetical protein
MRADPDQEAIAKALERIPEQNSRGDRRGGEDGNELNLVARGNLDEAA